MDKKSGMIAMGKKNILWLFDEDGVELAFQTVARPYVTVDHIAGLKALGVALGLGTITVDRGLLR